MSRRWYNGHWYYSDSIMEMKEMTRRNLIVLLIFVVIAGAIAGAFVFLSQIGTGGPAAIPSIYSSSSGAAIQQELTRYVSVPTDYEADMNLGVCL